jgi:hypothetical protein
MMREEKTRKEIKVLKQATKVRTVKRRDRCPSRQLCGCSHLALEFGVAVFITLASAASRVTRLGWRAGGLPSISTF